ncbi:FUSC family protein [Sulfobacillus harzensis]|uniref:FUSC family protein n=1 Tax=Sulfobacillus harzensis TaxID=2729629 RepID=A0A7Y0Q3I0_9FIRM|nr:FUSC family protein [Sulfobacillus harzensis]NMP22996.1 FUSC family protein [Sulfobacillus harzensis]
MVERIATIWDWIFASDPGLVRLRMGTNAAVSMASGLGLEYVVARMLHVGGLGLIIMMLLGAVMSMQGTLALTGLVDWRKKIKRAIFFPVAVGGGMAAGAATSQNTDLALGVFVVVMFVAVAIRKFGIPFFFYGFMGWMGYFFASFTRATLKDLPFMLLAVAVAAAWVLLLSLTILRTQPRQTLTRTLRAFGFRSRALAKAIADYLRADTEAARERLRLRVRTRAAQLSVAALMVEGWVVEPSALPKGWSALAVRRRLLAVQHAMDRMAWAATTLADTQGRVAGLAADIADAIARQDNPRARQLTALVRDVESPAHQAAYEFANAASEFLTLSAEMRWVHETEAAIGPDEFEPAVGLMMGDLPGSPAIGPTIPVRGHQWNPLARLAFPLRQAIQVAIAGGLAIVFGRALSPERYYWAVIAAFILSAGTATRVDALIKGVNRVLGTVAGLVAAVGLAQLTAGHVHLVLVVVVVSMFFGVYLFRFSYAYMIFFLTIMLAQLYSILHEFSTGLLMLRLEETAIGTICGLIVSLLIVPVSASDAVATVRRSYMDELHSFLMQAAEAPEAKNAEALEQQVRVLENRHRQLVQVADPITPPLAWGFSRPQVRHRLAMYAALTGYVRTLAFAVRHASSEEFPPNWRRMCLQLADVANKAKNGASASESGLPIGVNEATDHRASRLQGPLAQIESFLEDYVSSEPL